MPVLPSLGIYRTNTFYPKFDRIESVDNMEQACEDNRVEQKHDDDNKIVEPIDSNCFHVILKDNGTSLGGD